MKKNQEKSINLLNWVENLIQDTLYPELVAEKMPAEVPFKPFNFNTYKSA